MTHLFISYSSKDIDFARYLRRLLEERGLPVWMDEAQLSTGIRWWPHIEKNVEICAGLVVIMSPNARGSDWVEREILLAENLGKPIFPVLYMGDCWSRLANLQYEDLRAGLLAQLSAQLTANLERLFQPPTVNLSLAADNIASIDADVIALKHMWDFYGADLVIADLLLMNGLTERETLFVKPGDYALVEGGDVIGAAQALFVGTRQARLFDYQDVQELARRTLEILAEQAPQTQHLAMTMHGAGSGLDETQALIAQLNGYLGAFEARTYPPALERITIVEMNQPRLARLRVALEASFNGLDYVRREDDGWRYDLQQAGDDSGAGAVPEKPHAYVILADEPGDTFYYGIQQPIHANGLLCEPGPPGLLEDPELMQKAQQQISGATVVVADLTEADARVHLQLGYAWGRERPVIMVAKAGAPLSFPAPDCLRYETIHHLETQLYATLSDLKAQGAL